MAVSGFYRKATFFCAVAALVAVLGTAGCARTVTDFWREEAANRFAVPAHMIKRQITAEPFSITVFERIDRQGQPATIYIEGDGMAWASKTQPSKNPTPEYPVALHLATRDLSDNVIYVARPCQYSGMIDTETLCPQAYWTDRRFSVEAMASMDMVLEKLKARYDIRGFNLVGYAGGGAVATLLAAKRKDVLSLRTVAGNLDPDVVNGDHNIASMPGSLNPRDFAADTAMIPQHHFVGAWDDVVHENVYQSFRRAAGPSNCIRMSVVDEVNHEAGWVNRWPSLLQMPVDCKAGP